MTEYDTAVAISCTCYDIRREGILCLTSRFNLLNKTKYFDSESLYAYNMDVIVYCYCNV